jgi:hypothetical protein
MIILGKRRFVIQVNTPKGPGKNIVNEEGLTVPDPNHKIEYEYLWFAGVGLNPQMLAKGKSVPMNIWTPYPAQAHEYADRDDAVAVNEKVLGKQAGANVVEVGTPECMYHLGRSVIIPVDAEVLAGQALTGLKGRDKN